MKSDQSVMARWAILEKMKNVAANCEKLQRDFSRNESGRTTDAEWRRIRGLAANIRMDVAIMDALRSEFPELQRENPVEGQPKRVGIDAQRERAWIEGDQ